MQYDHLPGATLRSLPRGKPGIDVFADLYYSRSLLHRRDARQHRRVVTHLELPYRIRSHSLEWEGAQQSMMRTVTGTFRDGRSYPSFVSEGC